MKRYGIGPMVGIRNYGGNVRWPRRVGCIRNEEGKERERIDLFPARDPSGSRVSVKAEGAEPNRMISHGPWTVVTLGPQNGLEGTGCRGKGRGLEEREVGNR